MQRDDKNMSRHIDAGSRQGEGRKERGRMEREEKRKTDKGGEGREEKGGRRGEGGEGRDLGRGKEREFRHDTIKMFGVKLTRRRDQGSAQEKQQEAAGGRERHEDD